MLAELMHKVIAMDVNPDKPYYARPSLAGPDRCMRQMVYWARGEKKEKDFSGRMLQVLSDSSWGEETTADLIRKSAYQLHSEQMGTTLEGVLPWMPDATWHCEACNQDISQKDLHGHIDYLVTDMLGTDYLVDHKSINHFSHQRYCNGDIPYDYLSQLAIYVRGLQKYVPGLRYILLLMKNKNTSGYLELKGEYDRDTDTLRVFERVFHTGEIQKLDLIIPNITADAVAKFAKVEAHRVEGTLPERQYTLDDWQCMYCSYCEGCWAGYEKEHEKLTEDVALDSELSDLIRYEREVQGHEASAKKERKELKERIKTILKEKGIRSGRTNEYIIVWVVKTEKEFDKELLPPGVYASAQKVVPVEKMNIKKIKVKEAQKK